MRYASIILTLEHPVVTSWHFIIDFVTRFGWRCCRTILFVFAVQAVGVTVFLIKRKHFVLISSSN